MSVTISGDTGVSKVQDGVIVQADLASGVAGTGPAFSAYISTNQSISPNTTTKAQFNTEEFDTASCFDTSTYRFTPNVAGYYQINVMLRITAVTTNPVAIDTYLYKNGAVFKTAFMFDGTSVDGTANIACVVYMNGTTDYLEVYGRATNGTGNSFSGGSQYTFSGFLARAA